MWGGHGAVEETGAGTVLDALGLAVVAADLHGVITGWNAAAERVFGWTRAEAVGRRAVELIIPPESRPVAARLIDPLLVGEPWSGEFALRRRDGSRLPAAVSVWPVRAEDGAVTGAVGVLQQTTVDEDGFDPDATAVELLTRAFDPQLRAEADADPHATVLPTEGLTFGQLDDLLASLVALAVHTAAVGAERCDQPPQRIIAAAALRLRGL
jgi:PAS domain S-box-containing protein